MSFHASSEDIRLEDGHILKARLRDADGNYKDAEIDLNNFIGNDDGRFQWGGENFSESAEDIHFGIEGGASVPVLRARLRRVDGEFSDADINLGERVENQDGEFIFSKQDITLLLHLGLALLQAYDTNNI
ncbi:CVNH domain-containing protein [Durotheca rogersii]|uniref:CVNH domain-containing protein n=1 Tax=Durotheca rogersii TaxID=419775 RepID=UPI00221E6B66|nr:CVNH domain-containing protein [Durotheca rogersii]KAI5866315.1 CVNH domain-containing protein [Durotheca rogersii]